MYIIKHSAKGTTWSDHKYIRKEGNRYIYANTDTNEMKVVNPLGDVDVENYLKAEDEIKELNNQNNELRTRLHEIANMPKEERTDNDLKLMLLIEDEIQKNEKTIKEKISEANSKRYDSEGNPIRNMKYYEGLGTNEIKSMLKDAENIKLIENAKKDAQKNAKRANYMPSSDIDKMKDVNRREHVPATEYLKSKGNYSDDRLYKTSTDLKKKNAENIAEKNIEAYKNKKREDYIKARKKRERDRQLKFYKDLFLQHHGILGQKWGKRNGPPYPLDAEDYSAAEKRAEGNFDRGGDTKDKYESNKNKNPEINKQNNKSNKKPFDKEEVTRKGDIRSAYKHRRELTQNELEAVLKRYNTEEKYKEAIKKLDKKKRDDIIKFITGRTEDLETANRALKAIIGLADNLAKILPK